MVSGEDSGGLEVFAPGSVSNWKYSGNLGGNTLVRVLGANSVMTTQEG